MKQNILKAIRLDDDMLYGEETIATHLDCGVKTLQAWRTRGGGLPFVKVGRLVKYRGKDVKDWIAKRTVCSTSAPLPRGAA